MAGCDADALPSLLDICTEPPPSHQASSDTTPIFMRNVLAFSRRADESTLLSLTVPEGMVGGSTGRLRENALKAEARVVYSVVV